MNVNIKCTTDSDILKIKHNLHTSGELQLFSEFDKGETATDVFARIKENCKLHFSVVHSPLIAGDDVNIEYVCNHKDLHRLRETVKLAGFISNHQDSIVKVVFHTNLSYTEYEKFPYIFECILQFFEDIFYRYPKLEFCFENVVPVMIMKNGGFRMRNGCFEDSVYLANRLNSYFSTKRFGTVLDTCHAKTTIEVLKRHSDVFTLTLEDFFRINENVCKLVHLADLVDVGYKPNQHGVLFQEEASMHEILSLYEQYIPGCEITIEIKEDDYTLCTNFIHNLEMLNRLKKIS